MASIAIDTWKNSSYRRKRYRGIYEATLGAQWSNTVVYRTQSWRGRYRAIEIHKASKTITAAFIHHEAQAGQTSNQLRVRLPRKMALSMYHSLINKGLIQ